MAVDKNPIVVISPTDAVLDHVSIEDLDASDIQVLVDSDYPGIQEIVAARSPQAKKRIARDIAKRVLESLGARGAEPELRSG